MSRQSRIKWHQCQAATQLTIAVEQARKIWLGKLVQFDLQRGYERTVAALAFTLGYLLTVVEE